MLNLVIVVIVVLGHSVLVCAWLFRRGRKSSNKLSRSNSRSSHNKSTNNHNNNTGRLQEGG